MPKQHAATVASRAQLLRSDPAKAATILHDNPRDMGRVLGKAAATAAMAKLDAGGTTCSFDADTPVATLEGSTPIGELQVGDTVLAFNEASGMIEADPITYVWVNHDPAIAFLTIDGAQLDTTPEHPFFTAERGWVAAGDLQLGEHVRRLDGSVGVVESLRIEARPVVMYNLTVARAHTFFVGAGAWLVHNLCNPRRGNVRTNQAAGDAFRDKIAADFASAGYTVEKEVTKKTPFGPRRIDIEVSDANGKVLGGIETKVGGSRYRPWQRAKDEWLKRINNYPVTVVRDH